MPKLTISEKNASVELLNSHIEGFDVSGSIEIFEMLKRKKVSLDIETKQKLLELVCYHNEMPEIEETHNVIAGIPQELPIVWLEGNMAEKIYQVQVLF
jgi:hypothetical protein